MDHLRINQLSFQELKYKIGELKGKKLKIKREIEVKEEEISQIEEVIRLLEEEISRREFKL